MKIDWLNPFSLYRLVLFCIFFVMVIAAVIWRTRDGIRNARFRWRMRRSRVHNWRPGKCIKCGYDTRGNESRCSECGEPVQVMRPPPKTLL